MGIDWNHLFTTTDGRIGRRTYWIGIAALLVLQALSYALFGGGLVGIVARLVITLVGLAVMIKRCHDIGYTGWLSLVSFIPFIGFIFIIGLGLMPGTQGANAYGADPEAVVGHGATGTVDRRSDPMTSDAVIVDPEPHETRRDV